MKQPILFVIAAALTCGISWSPAAGTKAGANTHARRPHKTAHSVRRATAPAHKNASASKVEAATGKPKVAAGVGARAPSAGLASVAHAVGGPGMRIQGPAGIRPPAGGWTEIPPTPEQIAALRAQGESEKRITAYRKAGDLDSALAECNAAIDASAAASGGVASARLKHLLGAIYLDAGRYAIAYRIFEDIGGFYTCDDFVMDVALAAVHVGKPRQAEFLVRRFLSTFDPNGFAGRLNLLPGFGSPPAALATIHAARGLNYSDTCRDEEARVELNIAAQIAPYNAYIALVRAIALHFTGHDEQARACLEVAMRSDDPDVKTGANGMMRTVLEAEAKKKAEAEKSAEAKSNPGAGK